MQHFIRAASKKDIPLIHQLANKIWPIAYKEMISAPQIDYMLDKMYDPSALEIQIQNGDLFFIISNTDEDLGFASITLNEQFPNYTKLNKLYVLPSSHQKGIGKELFNFTMEFAKSQGQEFMFLNVNRANKAVDFYKKMGFEIWKSEDIDIGSGFWMNDYIMKKPL